MKIAIGSKISLFNFSNRAEPLAEGAAGKQGRGEERPGRDRERRKQARGLFSLAAVASQRLREGAQRCAAGGRPCRLWRSATGKEVSRRGVCFRSRQLLRNASARARNDARRATRGEERRRRDRETRKQAGSDIRSDREDIESPLPPLAERDRETSKQARSLFSLAAVASQRFREGAQRCAAGNKRRGVTLGATGRY